MFPVKHFLLRHVSLPHSSEYPNCDIPSLYVSLSENGLSYLKFTKFLLEKVKSQNTVQFYSAHSSRSSTVLNVSKAFQKF